MRQLDMKPLSKFKKGDDGIWRARAKPMRDRLDYQGNVSGRFVENLLSVDHTPD